MAESFFTTETDSKGKILTPGTIEDVKALAETAIGPKFVPNTRKINNKQLITDITLSATDVGAAPSSHNQTAATISDLTETVQDIVGGLIKAGTGVTVNYDDNANTFTINSTAVGGDTDPEIVRDVIGAAIVASSGIQVTVDDAGDKITVGVANIPASAISTGVLAPARLGSGTADGTKFLGGDGTWKTVSASWDSDKIAIARGYYEVMSETEPVISTYKASNNIIYPVVWVKPITLIVPVAPETPVFDNTKTTVLVPDLVGLEYKITQVIKGENVEQVNLTIPPNTPFDVKAETSQNVPFSVKIEAQPKTGYKLLSPAVYNFSFSDPEALTLITSDAFTLDSKTPPFLLDNELGGSGNYSWARISGEGAFGYIKKGGYFTPEADATDNTWIGVRVPGLRNVKLEFDLVSVGESLTNNNNGGFFMIHIRGFTSSFGGGVLINGDNYQTTRRHIKAPGLSIVAEPTSPDIIGKWSFQIYENVLTTTTPKGLVYNQDVSSSSLDSQNGGSDTIQFRHVKGASAGTKFDNLKIYKIG